MFTLNFKNLRDEVPLPRKRISYYVVKNPSISPFGDLQVDGEMKQGVTGFDWTGVESCGAQSCCYDYDDEESNSYPIGYETKFLDGTESEEEIASYETFKKVMYIKEEHHNGAYSGTFVLPFNSEKAEDGKDIEILWEYTHRVQYQLWSQIPEGGDVFPVGFIEELMEEGLLELTSTPILTDMKDRHSNYEYKHVTMVFNWLGNLWMVKGSQEGKWREDAWLDGKYAEMFVFDVVKIGEAE